MKDFLQRIVDEKFNGNVSKAGREMGIKPQIFHFWLRGKGQPSDANKDLIANYLNITVTELEKQAAIEPTAEDKLMRRIEDRVVDLFEKKFRENVEAKKYSDAEVQILELIKKLSDFDKELVVSLAKSRLNEPAPVQTIPTLQPAAPTPSRLGIPTVQQLRDGLPKIDKKS